MLSTKQLYVHFDFKVFKNTLLFLCLIPLIFAGKISMLPMAFGKADPPATFEGAPFEMVSKPPQLAMYETAIQESQVFGDYLEETNLPFFKSSINELTKDLRLKGTMIMEESEAIIENAKTNKTSFVKEGDRVGELTLAKILEGKVIFEYFGEEKEVSVS